MHKKAVYAVLGFVACLWLPAIAHAYPNFRPNWSNVEKHFLASSGRQSVYPHEYLPVLETRNAVELGKLTALRFIEWVKDNPKGVVAFTSGSTPEYFIKYLHYYKNNWHKAGVQAELQSLGIKLKKFPVTSNLKLVQLEDLYPMSPKHPKKMSNYVMRYYVKFLGLKKENVLLMDLSQRGILAERGLNVVFMNGKVDLSIMDHKPGSQLESWQQQAIRDVQAFCTAYENKIRAWGGIDFFVGGMSYGGYLGFNKPGDKLNSKTHYVKLDHLTAAHAAKDLGGFEHARGKIAITVGLGTMELKPNAVMIVIVAGDSKARYVQEALENKLDINYPLTVLQKYPNSRMYVTQGAAKLLNDRRNEDIIVKSKHGWNSKLIEDLIVEVALDHNKEIMQLTANDLATHPRGRILLQNPPKALNAILADVRASLIQNIERGLKVNKQNANRVLHISPHHDDMALGYYSLLDGLIYNYKNNFVFITSGFNSVSDYYVLSVINRASDWWINNEAEVIFNKPYEKVVNQFKNHYVKQDVEQMGMLETALALKHLVSIYNIKSVEELKHTVRWLKDEYFPNKQPGDADVEQIKLLKGMMRESEGDRLLSLKNVPLQNIKHLRSKFYSGGEFLRTPRFATDVTPFVALYNQIDPDIITVDDDPESAPPITQYRTLQLIAQGLRSDLAHENRDLQIWAYRNIWFRYLLTEANTYVPITEAMLTAEERSFNACFNTQRIASFPSPFFDGEFATLASLIKREQYAELRTLLGEDYFKNNRSAELKNAAGFILLKQMTLNEFFQHVEDLQQAVELEEAFELTRNT